MHSTADKAKKPYRPSA